MPEFHSRSLPEPTPARGDWSQAFAALPMETPDAGGWARIGAALPEPRRARWPLWLATAAALALVAVLPLKLTTPDPAAAPAATAARAGDATPAASHAATIPMHTGSTQAQPPLAIASSETGDNTATGTPGPASRAQAANTSRAAASPRTSAAAHGRQDEVLATPARADAVPDTALAGNVPAPSTAVAAVGDVTAVSELERLYADSAQLESLLAFARDERVSTGTAAVLASEFDAQVAGIDAALTQPGITPAQRTDLWRKRVHALRQVATFESTQRLLAAQGERYDATLVSVD